MGEVIQIRSGPALFVVQQPLVALSLAQRMLAAYDLVAQAERPLRLSDEDDDSGLALIARAALLSMSNRTVAARWAESMATEIRVRA